MRGYVWAASIKSRDRYNDALAEWLYWLNHARLPHIDVKMGKFKPRAPRRLTCVVKTPIRRQNRRVDSANESATCTRSPTPSRRGYAASWQRAALHGWSARGRLPQASRSSKTRIHPTSPRDYAKRAPLVYIAAVRRRDSSSFTRPGSTERFGRSCTSSTGSAPRRRLSTLGRGTASRSLGFRSATTSCT